MHQTHLAPYPMGLRGVGEEYPLGFSLGFEPFLRRKARP